MIAVSPTQMKNDHQLKRDVESELAWEPSVDEAHIGVTAKSGIITLSGHVSTFGEKYAAEKAAKRVGGVQAVANEIDVKLSTESPMSDEDVAASEVACGGVHREDGGT